MSRCPEPKSDADVCGLRSCMAMISTLHSVWLRPAVLGGFGGMSDRSFLFLLSSVRLVLDARRWEKVFDFYERRVRDSLACC
jgi:uncharacterized membrane protein